MLILGLGVAVCGLAIGALWWARRRRKRSGLRRVVTILGTSVLVVGLTTIGTYLWALTATDTSQFARSLVWGGSAFGDQDRFPSRTIEASEDPVIFEPVADSPVAAYEADGSGRSLDQFLDDGDTTAFIVLHGDRLLYEGYFNGSSHNSTQTSFSVAKSFTATLLGIALDDGHITSLEDPVTTYVPELTDRDERFTEITLRHLLTMSSGLSFEDGASPWADPANTYHGTDLRSAVLSEPTIEQPPGTRFHYNDWNVILLGLVLERATGMSVSDYMQQRLWQPMGAEADGSWSLDSDRHGFEKTFVGVNGRAIDLAKLGWIYLNEGYNGEHQVVSSAYIAEATSVDTTTDPASHYQYLWWIDEDRDSYYANGDHGQFIYVDPGADLVIAHNGRSGDIDWIGFMGELADWLEPQLVNPET
ncbi:MAG: serine hydrolase [Actinomycetia bacterium]|nr:serine hydrolase [Actinomycetes bacterium]